MYVSTVFLYFTCKRCTGSGYANFKVKIVINVHVTSLYFSASYSISNNIFKSKLGEKGEKKNMFLCSLDLKILVTFIIT